MYKIQKFAELAGVTVRALHHYDRLGLLKPKRRTASRYRLYSLDDLVRLEQIVVLKFLGLPLREIGALLSQDSDLSETLRRQQKVLAMRRSRLDATIEAIQYAETSLASHIDWNVFTKIIKEIEMQNDTEWTKQYYSSEAQPQLEERKALWSPELQERVGRQWAELFAEVEAALHEDPSSPKAQELAARWSDLVGQFTAGNSEIHKGLNAMYADQGNWPEQQQQSYSIKPEVMAFVMAAIRAKG